MNIRLAILIIFILFCRVIFFSNKESSDEIINPLPPLRDIPITYMDAVTTAVNKANIPIEVIAAIITVESNWDRNAKSPKRDDGHRDLGICQFNSKYLDWFSKQYNNGKSFNPMNPEIQ